MLTQCLFYYYYQISIYLFIFGMSCKYDLLPRTKVNTSVEMHFFSPDEIIVRGEKKKRCMGKCCVCPPVQYAAAYSRDISVYRVHTADAIFTRISLDSICFSK